MSTSAQSGNSWIYGEFPPNVQAGSQRDAVTSACTQEASNDPKIDDDPEPCDHLDEYLEGTRCSWEEQVSAHLDLLAKTTKNPSVFTPTEHYTLSCESLTKCRDNVDGILADKAAGQTLKTIAKIDRDLADKHAELYQRAIDHGHDPRAFFPDHPTWAASGDSVVGSSRESVIDGWRKIDEHISTVCLKDYQNALGELAKLQPALQAERLGRTG